MTDPSPKKEQTQPLSTVWKRRTEYSGYASQHVRTSALAGLAVAWLFAGGTEGDLNLLADANRCLLVAAALFAASLASDILHYYTAGAMWRRLGMAAEAEGKVGDEPVVVPPSTNAIPQFFYDVKVWLLFTGYVVLVVEFLKAVF